MTALPATRQSAMWKVECIERAVAAARATDAHQAALTIGHLTQPRNICSSEDFDTLIALARRGADTVGATEAWLSREGFTYTQKIRPEMRRCLILPESQNDK